MGREAAKETGREGRRFRYWGGDISLNRVDAISNPSSEIAPK